MTKNLTQDEIKVICKCGSEMEFKYFEFALSSFECNKCGLVFVHDDWNEPNNFNPRLKHND